MSGHSGFTVEDANRRLPLVRMIVRDAMELKANVIVQKRLLLKLRRGDGDARCADEILEVEEAVEQNEIRIDEFATELQQIGAELMNPGVGLIEFSSTLGEQPVRLSWMYDEPEVAFWRSEGELPEDRKPLALAGQGAG